MIDNSIFKVKDTFFYLPQHAEDCIQQCIKISKNYWDMDAHRIIDKYLKDNAVILDIGANIGSHTLYWAMERNAKKIYSFEPYDIVYETLLTNIKLNYLQPVVTTYNFGLSDVETKASKGAVNVKNLGSTQFVKNSNGEAVLKPLDLLKIKEKIHLIKIDVEGHEVEVLKGAIDTIKKSKPVLVIESFKRKKELEEIIFPLGYIQVDTIREGEDFVYIHKA